MADTAQRLGRERVAGGALALGRAAMATGATTAMAPITAITAIAAIATAAIAQPATPASSVAASMPAAASASTAATAPTAAVAADPSTLHVAATREPRAFGYRIGDVVARDVRAHVPDGLALEAASLPRTGARGGALELRRLERRLAAEPGGQRLDLHLEYQVFLAPVQVRTLEMPPLTLVFRGRPRDQDLRIDAWPVTVAPLVPVDVSPRRGLGELQPDAEAPRLETAAVRQRLVAWAAGIALAGLFLLQVYVALPWWRRRGRPFEAAWRALRRLPADAGAAPASQAALRRLHAAVNASAGEAVFAHGLDRYLRAHPRFEPARAEFEAFFERSRREFFGPANAGSEDTRGWLFAFARRCRDLERGSA